MYEIDGIERRRPGDRRSGIDRRTISDTWLVERRAVDERRVPVERRTGYVRVTQWDSAFLGIDLNELPELNQPPAAKRS